MKMKKILFESMIVVGLVLIILGILNIIYNNRVNNVVVLIEIPVANSEIDKGVKITSDMIKYKKIEESEYNEIEAGIYVYSVDAEGLCAASTIEEDSYFFIDLLDNCE